MFILGDEGHYHGRFPWVTTALVFVNVAVYTLQAFLGAPFTNGFSLVPAEITEFRDLTRTEYVTVKVPFDAYRDRSGRTTVLTTSREVPIEHAPGPFPIVLTLFTSMFLHGGLIHLIGNMWFLLVFGRNVECALDHGRFLFFYTLCGVVGGLAHVASGPHSVIPCLGASGAISGVMGAYVAIHPFNKIKVWMGWYFGRYYGVVEVPALVVVGFWFVVQYVGAVATLDRPDRGGGIASWAHLGGFVAGLFFIWATVLYLKWQLSKLPPQPTAEERHVAVEDEAGSQAGLPDPFANFLPPR